MSVDFANVTAVTIPQGDVTKITDSSGRVLWQKMQEGYPRFFMMAKTASTNYSTSFFRYISGSYAAYSPPSSLQKTSSIPINSVMNNTGGIVSGNTIAVGNKLSACYVTNSTEEANALTSAQKLTDAQWLFSTTWMIPGTYTQVYGLQGQAVTNFGSGYSGVATTTRPLTFSSTSGAEISITSIKTPSSYKSLYEANAGNSYVSASSAPYLYVCFSVAYKSSNLESLAGGMPSTGTNIGLFNSLPAYSPILTFYLTILR